MKHLIIIITTLVLILSGCERAPRYSRLEASPSAIHASDEGGEFLVEVTGPSDWTSDNTSGWISIRKKDGNALITIKKNTGAEREREISFSSYPLSTSIFVSQDRSDIFTATPASLAFSYKGGSGQIEVECYSRWSAETDCDWISLETTEGDSPAFVQITVQQSFERYARTAAIRFVSTEGTRTVTLTQAPSPYIEVERNTIETDGDGGQFKVLYISNTDVTKMVDVPWIRLIDTGTDSREITFEVMRNHGERRTGTITVSSVADSDYFKTITINQGGKIDHPALSFEEGSHLDIARKETFILHPVFTDMKDTSLFWESDRPDIATADQSGNITVHTGGTCTISAANAFHGITATITLNIRIAATSMRLVLDGQDMDQNPTAVRFRGEALTVTALMDPEDAYTGDLVCITSDSGIAGTEGMQINCLSPGKATISVESLYHGLRKSFELIILED